MLGHPVVDATAKPPAALAKKSCWRKSRRTKRRGGAEGTFDDWAIEAFMLSTGDAYGNLPLSTDTPQHLDSAYAAQAEMDVSLQLSKAGVRLASVLNKALSSQVADLDPPTNRHQRRRLR